jgi:branched-chain amino acid transport system substrate-binding protein
VGTDKEALRNELEATKNYVGISGTYNITEEDHNGLDVDSMVIVEVQDGTFVLAK